MHACSRLGPWRGDEFGHAVLTMSCAAIGKFDALHRGHKALVAEAQNHGESCILTFQGMAEVLGWEPRPPLLAAKDRAAILADWQVAEVILPFADIRSLSPRAFLERLREIGIHHVVVGEDFRFGRDRRGDASHLPGLAAELGLGATVVPMIADGAEPVSSSRIRQALEQGNVAAVRECLGRPYRLHGTVVRGDGRGRSIGIPTCNCGDLRNLAPGGGVYAAWAHLDGESAPIRAAVNAGHVPTAGGNRPFVVEAHLLDWSGDAYGREIALDLVTRLRDEQRFPDLAALVTQIKADIDAVRAVLAST